MVNNKIKELRKNKNLSQEGLARQVDVSVRTIQNIEKNSNTDLETAFKIKKALEAKNIEEIFTE